MHTTCCRCKGPLDEPYPRARWCRACQREKWRANYADRSRTPEFRAKVNARLREKRKDPEWRKRANRQAAAKRYGLTLAQYAALLAEAERTGCAICGGAFAEAGGRGDGYYLDHCHSSGRVRGVLCCNCNLALGMFRDSPTLLLRAHEYLMGDPARLHAFLKQAEAAAPPPKRKPKPVHCPTGHPYQGDNLYIDPKGAMVCRECMRLAQRPGSVRQIPFKPRPRRRAN